MAIHLRFGRHNDVKEQVRVGVDQPWKERRTAEIDCVSAGRSADLRCRANLLDLVPFDQNGGRREYIPGARIE
ncbi:MAG TPA: hypothetical protein VLJ17_15095 [Xanthobacteraceae bacterium]|nr:hypothetical protein [Xanthobacteraceae bacterium]